MRYPNLKSYNRVSHVAYLDIIKMADYSFNGILKSVYCGLCFTKFSFECIHKHACFAGATEDELSIIGNVVNLSTAETIHNVKSKINESEISKQKNINGQNDIELADNGEALLSDTNLIHLIEYVKKEPCIWNYKLPISARSPAKVADSWMKISRLFRGWTPEITKKRFSNLN
ncbi:uncharacterized protein LOC122512699 [Leptopilina heterotoma]|uniref:uncharacterized protein LOC122512699 n=1 Tax=Leptopilina heterotoma TaxID=63436 RepID=UPI001CA883B9|nr:uncharacterized protein LOC122512699 [Leptopilina heterotoma]